MHSPFHGEEKDECTVVSTRLDSIVNEAQCWRRSLNLDLTVRFQFTLFAGQL